MSTDTFIQYLPDTLMLICIYISIVITDKPLNIVSEYRNLYTVLTQYLDVDMYTHISIVITDKPLNIVSQ